MEYNVYIYKPVEKAVKSISKLKNHQKKKHEKYILDIMYINISYMYMNELRRPSRLFSEQKKIYKTKTQQIYIRYHVCIYIYTLCTYMNQLPKPSKVFSESKKLPKKKHSNYVFDIMHMYILCMYMDQLRKPSKVSSSENSSCISSTYTTSFVDVLSTP